MPALVLPGTALVVSPLISLIQDHVDELDRRGIRATALHSVLSADARAEALRPDVPVKMVTPLIGALAAA